MTRINADERRDEIVVVVEWEEGAEWVGGGM